MQSTMGITITERMNIPQTWVRDLILALIGSILIAVSAQVVVRLPFSPVPITGQTFAVLLLGFLFGGRLAVISVIMYLIEGISGLPVFAGGGAGIVWLLGPTGGYLLGFVVAAGVVGTLAERGNSRRLLPILSAFLFGQAVIYLFGVTWLSVFSGWSLAFQTGMVPFLIGDLVKALLAAGVLLSGWRIIESRK